MVRQVGYSVVRRSRGRMTSCAVYTVHVEMTRAGFLVEPQNQGPRFGLKTTRTVFVGLTSKPVVMVSGGLASKPAATVFSGLASEPVATVFSSLASKLVAMVSPSLASKPVVNFLVEPQNQGGGGFLLVWASKPAASV
jgi:hypothetical protein